MERKVALITGSSSGIGAATAIEFAKKGVCVVIHGRNKQRLQEVATQCQQTGLPSTSVLTVSADLTNNDQLKSMVDQIISQFGRLDILVNNAGHVITGSVEESDEHSLDEMYNIHTRAPYVLTRMVIPHLKARKGCVVNVSSVCSLRPKVGVHAYGMAKAAQDSFTQYLALELAEYGVRVNAVNPGYVKTNMDASQGREELEKFYERVGKVHPLEGRCAEPYEVAQGIVYLASADSSFITGVNLTIDGGLMMTMKLPGSS